MKKLLCMILSLLLCSSLLFACGDGESKETAQMGETQSSGASSTETAATDQSTWPVHEHSFDTWEKNQESHRLVCYCGDGTEWQAHTFLDGICQTCGKSNLASEWLDYNVDESINGVFIRGRGGCTDSDIVIPDKIDGVDVVAIAYGAFTNDTMTSITFPETLKSIGRYAFEGCKNLTEIVLPNGFETIEQGAFLNCTALTSVNMPETVTSIYGNAFMGCTGLKEIAIPHGVAAIDQSTFLDCTALETISIPSTVKTLGECAMYNCSSLKSIIFNGTQEEWNRITKQQEWNYGTGAYTLTCLK